MTGVFPAEQIGQVGPIRHCCNNPVAFGDVTDMRTVRRVPTPLARALAGAVLVAAAGVGVSTATSATSNADPAGHHVRYTLTTQGPADFDLFYLVNQPPNKAAYNADAYSFVKKETVNVGPDAPWVFETTLADPQWAIFTVSSTTHGGQAAPNPHCEIAVDGQTAVQQDGPYNLQCKLSQW
jgi:hypothetical protein